MYDYDFSDAQNQVKEFANKCVEANTKSWALGTQYLEDANKRQEALVTELVESSSEAFKPWKQNSANWNLFENSNAFIKNLQDRYLELAEENSSAYMSLASEVQKLYAPLFQIDEKVEKPVITKKKRAA